MSTAGPVDEQFKEQMQGIAEVLDATFNPDTQNKTVGFILLTFEIGEEGRMNYMSNCVREDCICAMKEFVARAEGLHIEETQTPEPRKDQ